MAMFTIDSLPDKGLLNFAASDTEEEERVEKREKRPKNERKRPKKNKKSQKDPEADALEKFLFGSAHGSNLLQSTEKQKPRKKQKKAAWKDEDDLIPAEDGLANAVRYPKKVNKETLYQSYLVDKFETIYGKPKWAEAGSKKRKDGSDDEELVATAGNILVKGKRLAKGRLKHSRCAALTSNQRFSSILASVQFHPQSKVALIAGCNGKVALTQMDGRENSLLNNIFLENFHLNRARFSVDGKEVIMGTKQSTGYFYSYDIVSGTSNRVPLIQAQDRLPLKNFVLSPDNQFIASCGRQGDFYLLSTNPKEIISTYRINEPVYSLHFSPDSSKLFAGGEDSTIFVFDVRQSRRCLHRFTNYGSLSCESMAICPNGRYFVSTDKPGSLNIYKYEDILSSQDPKPMKTLNNMKNVISSLKFNHSSEFLAVSSLHTKNAIRLVHFPSLTVFSNFPEPDANYERINEIDISPNSGYLAFSNNVGMAHLHRLNHYSGY